MDRPSRTAGLARRSKIALRVARPGALARAVETPQIRFAERGDGNIAHHRFATAPDVVANPSPLANTTTQLCAAACPERAARRDLIDSAPWKLSAVAGILLLGCLVPSGVVRAQPRPADDAAATPPTVDFGRAAEEVAARLRQLTRSLSDSAVFAALEAEVAADAHRIAERWDETGRLVESHLRPSALDSIAIAWQALRSELDGINGRIEERAKRREDDLATLTKLHESWARALDLARKADAAPAVIERAQSTLAAIEATRPAIEQRRARVLVLQDAVSRAFQTCDDALARIADARREAVERVFTRQEPPLWQRERPLRDAQSGGLGLAGDVWTKIENVGDYVRTYRGGLALSGLVILGLMALMGRGRFRIRDVPDPDQRFESAAGVFRAPYAGAILLGLLISRPLRPFPPVALQQVFLAIVTTAAIFVLRPLLDSRLAVAVYMFGALLVLNLVSGLLDLPATLQQVVLIVEMVATAALLLWAAAQFGETRALASGVPRLRKVGRIFARIVACACGASAVAAALGYLDLADFLGVSLFYCLFLAFGLLAIRVTLDGLVTIGLDRGPLARLHTVARYRALIARRTRGALDVGTMAVWLWLVLMRFEVLEPTRTLLQGILEARLRVGELDLPFAHVLAFAAVVIGVFIATRVVGTLLEEDVYSRMTLPRGVPYALSTLTRYGLLLAGFLLALATLGLDLTRITVLVSALGLGLGFGLQQIMNNFVSGLILLFERPVQVGDSIQMGDLGGEVLRIGIRSSTVRTPQGAEVIVPNSKIIEEKVTNWTLSDRRRRVELDISVKGDADGERIITLLGDVARRDPRVIDTPPPEALLVRFGEDATDFQLRFWTDDPDWTRLRSDLAVALQSALRAARLDDCGRAKAETTTS